MFGLKTLVAVDAGRSGTKVYDGKNKVYFPSRVSKWRKRNVKETLPGDMELEYGGKKYFVGQLAEREGEFARSMFTKTKANDETVIETLAALYRVNVQDVVEIAMPIPIYNFTKEERKAIKERLLGEHVYVVNDEERRVYIEKVHIGIECGVALHMFPQIPAGTVRFLDPGAKTTNYATFKDGIFIDRDSGTLEKGWESVKNKDAEELAQFLTGELAKMWDESDIVYLLGGNASGLLPHFGKNFPDTRIVPEPLFANAIGMWHFANKKRLAKAGQ